MSNYGVLKELGLSKTAILCYASLIEEGPATARKLAERLQIPHSNIYGVLTKLVRQGFIEKLKLPLSSALFMARLPDTALAENYMYRRRKTLSLCRELGIGDPPALQILPRQRQASRQSKNKP